MSTIQMARILQPLSEYSDNLLNYNSTFNDNLTFSVTSGSGIAQCNSAHTFQGTQALKITNYLSTPMTVSTGSDLGFTASQTGSYIFSLRLFYESSNGDDPSFLLNIFRNGVPSNQYNCFYSADVDPDTWLLFAQSMDFDAGDVITYSFDFNPAFANDSIWCDGLKCELDDRNLGIPTAWSMPKDFCCSDKELHIVETQWDVTTITPTTVTNGSSLNLLTLINNVTNKNVVNSDVYDQLNIVSNSIKTTYRGCKIIHTIRVSFNINSGSDQFYQMQIRRTIDNSVVYRTNLQRNADETIQTVEMTTRTLSNTDPFVVDGFYLAFVNNSGASADLSGSLSVLVISHYQKGQKQ